MNPIGILAVVAGLAIGTSPYRSERLPFASCMKGPGQVEQSAGGDLIGITGCDCHDYDFDGDVDLADWAVWSTLSRTRTAADPSSWLVLYRDLDSSSSSWARWYAARRGIPTENLVALRVSAGETVTIDEYAEKIRRPVLERLEADRRLMAVVVGFGVPGAFRMPAPWGPESETLPQAAFAGGYSIPNALMAIARLPGPVIGRGGTWQNFPTARNPAFYSAGAYETPRGIPTRSTLGAGWLITARIDGPSLEAAEALSPASRSIPRRGWLYLDAEDPVFGLWGDLEVARALFPMLAWRDFDSEKDATPGALFRASWHRISGWPTKAWSVASPGPQLLAVDHDSFSATTVRSLGGDGGRFCPSALAGGWLSCIGATAEPTGGSVPDISTLWAVLLQGRPLGEAAFVANPHGRWMWTLVGDGLLRLEP